LASIEDSTHALRRAFDMVIFDLDDTLVPTYAPIASATEQLFEFMATSMPKSLPDAKISMRTHMSR